VNRAGNLIKCITYHSRRHGSVWMSSLHIYICDCDRSCKTNSLLCIFITL